MGVDRSGVHGHAEEDDRRLDAADGAQRKSGASPQGEDAGGQDAQAQAHDHRDIGLSVAAEQQVKHQPQTLQGAHDQHDHQKHQQAAAQSIEDFALVARCGAEHKVDVLPTVRCRLGWEELAK